MVFKAAAESASQVTEPLVAALETGCYIVSLTCYSMDKFLHACNGSPGPLLLVVVPEASREVSAISMTDARP